MACRRKKHTTAVFDYLKWAYDKVWRKGLLHKMIDTGDHGQSYKWVKSFFIIRTIQTKQINSLSSKEILEDDLP